MTTSHFDSACRLRPVKWNRPGQTTDDTSFRARKKWRNQCNDGFPALQCQPLFFQNRFLDRWRTALIIRLTANLGHGKYALLPPVNVILSGLGNGHTPCVRRAGPVGLKESWISLGE